MSNVQPTSKETVPIRLKIASKFSGLSVVCAFVQGACKALAPHLSEEDIRNLELAVNEACSNIIRHAYHNDESKAFWLTAHREEDVLVFTMVDKGEPALDSFLGKEPRPVTFAELREHGYGVILMEQLMDDIQYRRDPRRGNVLVLKKKLLLPKET